MRINTSEWVKHTVACRFNNRQDIPDMAVDDVGEELEEGGVVDIVQFFIEAVDGTLGMSVPGLLRWSHFMRVGLHSS